ncbi:hypothetical protein [Natronohydrobacter thiooxidans]|uniref:hypothetical protein n=1 Tax=Natronohydrobacter thiooxidans TaxID=87172 RepID=UPI0008FF3E04|nr:hypothetical protein [Natronohydrobacter thiooxidans]
MSIIGFLIAILSGLVAAGYALSGGSGLLLAVLAYSLGGAAALVLSMTVIGFFLPARASPAAGEMP